MAKTGTLVWPPTPPTASDPRYALSFWSSSPSPLLSRPMAIAKCSEIRLIWAPVSKRNVPSAPTPSCVGMAVKKGMSAQTGGSPETR